MTQDGSLATYPTPSSDRQLVGLSQNEHEAFRPELWLHAAANLVPGAGSLPKQRAGAHRREERQANTSGCIEVESVGWGTRPPPACVTCVGLQQVRKRLLSTSPRKHLRGRQACRFQLSLLKAHFAPTEVNHAQYPKVCHNCFHKKDHLGVELQIDGKVVQGRRCRSLVRQFSDQSTPLHHSHLVVTITAGC